MTTQPVSNFTITLTTIQQKEKNIRLLLYVDTRSPSYSTTGSEEPSGLMNIYLVKAQAVWLRSARTAIIIIKERFKSLGRWVELYGKKPW